LILNQIPSVEEPPAGMGFFVLHTKSSGDIRDVMLVNSLQEDNGWPNKQSKYKVREQCYKLEKSRRMWRLQVCVFAKDKQHAIKMAGELRTQLLTGLLPNEGKLPLT